MTPQEQYGGSSGFTVVLLCLKNESPLTSIGFCTNKVYPLRLQKSFVDSDTSANPSVSLRRLCCCLLYQRINQLRALTCADWSSGAGGGSHKWRSCVGNRDLVRSRLSNSTLPTSKKCRLKTKYVELDSNDDKIPRAYGKQTNILVKHRQATSTTAVSRQVKSIKTRRTCFI